MRVRFRKTIGDINDDFIERNFAGVIKEISLRPLPSSDKLMQLLLEIKKFSDENQHNMGEADLFRRLPVKMSMRQRYVIYCRS